MLLNLASNINQLFKEPGMFPSYLYFKLVETVKKSPPIATFSDNIQFSQFVSFSEYWHRKKGIPEVEINLIKLCYQICHQKNPDALYALDVGANLGLFSLVMAQVGFSSILAFEPIPNIHQRLLKNLELNPHLASQIQTNLIGLSKEAGILTFCEKSRSPGQSKIVTSSDESEIEDWENSSLMSLEVTTLDQFIQQSALPIQPFSVGFLKIDVEGFELDVLRGATALLSHQAIAFIYMEIIEKALTEAGTNITELESFLAQYQLFPAIANFEDKNLQACSIETALEWAGNRRNVLFAHERFII